MPRGLREVSPCPRFLLGDRRRVLLRPPGIEKRSVDPRQRGVLASSKVGVDHEGSQLASEDGSAPAQV